MTTLLLCSTNIKRHVATFWVLLAQISDNQHVTTCCAQQCCHMLRSFGQGFRVKTVPKKAFNLLNTTLMNNKTNYINLHNN